MDIKEKNQGGHPYKTQASNLKNRDGGYELPAIFLINLPDNTEHLLLMKTVHTVKSYKTGKSEPLRQRNGRTSTTMEIWREGKKNRIAFQGFVFVPCC